MKIVNGKIVEATEAELLDYYLKRELDDIYPFTEYVEKMIAAGVEIAVEALREKQERDKGCGFCNTGAHRILQNALCCPRCGKRLEGKP